MTEGLFSPFYHPLFNQNRSLGRRKYYNLAFHATSLLHRIVRAKALEEVPKDYGGGVGYIQGVLGATLRNFYAAIAGIDGTLAHAFHLIA